MSGALIFVPPPGSSGNAFLLAYTQSKIFGRSKPLRLYSPPPFAASPTILYLACFITSPAISRSSTSLARALHRWKRREQSESRPSPVHAPSSAKRDSQQKLRAGHCPCPPECTA